MTQRISSRAGLDPAWIVIAAGVCAALHVGKLPPAIAALQAALGLTLVQAGFLLSLVQLAGMLLGVVFGLAADTLGPRRSVLLGLGVLTLASATVTAVLSRLALSSVDLCPWALREGVILRRLDALTSA